MRLIVLFCLAMVLSPPAPPAFGLDFDMVQFFRGHAVALGQDPVVLDALRAQNRRTADLTLAEIQALDDAWHAAQMDETAPIVIAVTQSPSAEFLRRQIAESAGHLTELFFMDAKGLTVAAAAPTTDLWQGEEPKFRNSFGQGPDGVHVSPILYDASSDTYQAQISVAVLDPETGEVIGALTVGIPAWSLI